MADIMPNMVDGKATAVHIVPHKFLLFCWWQVGQPL